MSLTTPWSVNFAESRELDLTSLVVATQKLQMTTQVSSLYPYIEWVVNAPLTYVELGYFRIGQGIQFTFNEERNVLQPTYTFYIDSIYYTEMSADPTGPATIYMILSTGFLFKDKIMDKGYYGTVAHILTQMFNEELSLSSALSSIKVVEGLDTPMKRFRTYQNAKDFIETRLTSSFRGEKESFTYIMSDLNSKLIAMDVVRAGKELTTFHCFHPGYHDSAKKGELARDSNIKGNIAVFDAMAVELNKERELWQASNAGISTLYRTNTPKVLGDFPVFRMFPPMEDNHMGMFPMTSKKSKEYKDLTEVFILDDQNDYAKAYTALSFARSSSLLDALKITLSVDINFNFQAGHIAYLYPPSMKTTTPYIASILEGPWLVTEASHVLKGIRGRTYLTLQATSLKQRGILDKDARFYRQE